MMDDDDDNEESSEFEDYDDQENRDVMEEAKRVKALLKEESIKVDSSNSIEPDNMVKAPEKLLKELFHGVYERLDTIAGLLQQQASEGRVREKPLPKVTCSPRASLVLTEDSSLPSSPNSSKAGEQDPNQEEFIYNGTNLLNHVNAKAKKPKLYATALLSILFSDEEMRIGSVEPKDGGAKKLALDQGKIDLLKKCIKARYGEKVLEKSWSEIRISLNQKCLDKQLKAHRKNVKEEKADEEGLVPL